MSENKRKRPDPIRLARQPRRATFDTLEHRQLMTGGMYYYAGVYPPRFVDHSTAPLALPKPIGSNPSVLKYLDNEGQVISGTDRQGDQWTITVHGPGAVIVTDITPNDGVLHDEIDTIQIINSDPNKTYVTGQVVASSTVITDGTINFNHLTAEKGVHSILLNGFNLTNTTLPYTSGQPYNVGPEVYLPKGVQYLQFNNIEAAIDTSTNTQPFEIVIGAINTPIKKQPNIKIGSVFNSVVDSTLTTQPYGSPQTTPTVNFVVNGGIHKIEMVSATAHPISNAGMQYNYPAATITGRTAIRATSIGSLKVDGAATNLVASRAGTPYQVQNGQAGVPAPIAPTTKPFVSTNSGLKSLKRAQFGGPTDGVGLDVQGKIGTLKFNKGIGNPTGVLPGASNLGYNAAQQGYASYGDLGGLIKAQSIHKVLVGPANMNLRTSTNPNFQQLHRRGSTTYYAEPGNALTSTAIVTQGSIGQVHIVGNSQNSQIATGFDYQSYMHGLNPVRSPSVIKRFNQRGSLVDSVVSASAVPGTSGAYKNGTNPPATDTIYGPGGVTGVLTGSVYSTSTASSPSVTALGYQGAGVYARHKHGILPPPNLKTRPHGTYVRPV